mgnify:FL=1
MVRYLKLIKEGFDAKSSSHIGLRNSLKNEINRGLSRARVTKVTSMQYLDFITLGY